MTKISKSAARSAKSAAVNEAIVVSPAEFLDAGYAALNDLIASLDAPDEIFEAEVETATPVMDDAMLEAAVSGAEATEAMIAAATPEGVEGSEAPTGDVSDVVADPEAAAPAVKAKKEPKEKKVAVPRKRYTDKTERLKDHLGAELAGYSILTLADAGVTDEELGAKVEETMAIVKSMNGKSQIWATKFIEYLAGKKASISEVTGRVLKLLNKDGFIQTGATGNLYLDLIAKPYSPGAARAMGGNNLAMLSFLKLIQADGKGRFVANPDSLLLMKANGMLFCESPEAAEEDAELAA
jgi:hypothetical protein